MSTLTIRAIEDDYYFLSFNPDGESWCSMRPEFQMASSVMCQTDTSVIPSQSLPRGQNTIFLTDNDDKKIWNNQTFNPPLYFEIMINNTSQTVYIPMCQKYTQQTLVIEINNLLSVLGIPYSLVVFSFNNVFTITNNNISDVKITFNNVLASALGFSETISIPASLSVSGLISPFELYYIPKTVNDIKITSNKMYKGQYYIALEDCNIRVKNNFDSININQPLNPLVYYSRELLSQTITVDGNVFSLPSQYYTVSGLVQTINSILLANGFIKLSLSFDTNLNIYTFSNTSNVGSTIVLTADLANMLGMPLNFIVTGIVINNIKYSQELSREPINIGSIAVRIYASKKVKTFIIPENNYTLYELVELINDEINGEMFDKIRVEYMDEKLIFSNLDNIPAKVEISSNFKNYLGFSHNVIELNQNEPGKYSGNPVSLQITPKFKPLIFEDTCIFVQVEIFSSAEQGNLMMQNFNKGVIINYEYSSKEKSVVNNYPFETRKILFPVMMRRDIPPWNGSQLKTSNSVLPDPTIYPNARTTGFSSENRSKSVFLIPLGYNEQFKVSFWRSNGEKLHMATDYNLLNPNLNVCFPTTQDAENYFNSLDRGWFVSQASVMLRVSNARPEYL